MCYVFYLVSDFIAASDHVRLLGVTISSDLSLDRHVSTLSASSFYWLCQLRRSRCSLDVASTSTLVHAFVSSSHIDYCNAVLAGSKVTMDRLQRVLNAAALVVSGTQKYDRGLSRLLRTELHWLDVPERQVQAQHYGAQLSKWPSTPVRDRLLPLTLCSHISTASQIHQFYSAAKQ